MMKKWSQNPCYETIGLMTKSLHVHVIHLLLASWNNQPIFKKLAPVQWRWHNWGRVDIHMFVFCTIHLFWNRVSTNIWISWPSPIIDLQGATASPVRIVRNIHQDSHIKEYYTTKTYILQKILRIAINKPSLQFMDHKGGCECQKLLYHFSLGQKFIG